MSAIIQEIINSDGTKYDPPVHPEMYKLEEKYPTCNSWGYKCMYCDKCMMGEHFKPANDEERRILEEHSKLVHEYTLEHNPDIKALLEKHGK